HQKVQEGTFRHDLFFRLNVFGIHVPPLRERPDDMPLLVQHFLRRLGVPDLPVPPATLEHLAARSWPGNVRELRNALEHAVIVAPPGPLLPEPFPAASGDPSEPASRLTSALRDWIQAQVERSSTQAPANLHEDMLRLMEATLFAEIMQHVRGNRWHAA